ncbi:MAG TPA: hypothetical protein VF313_08400 [Anaerolineaceae bacterium]
MPYVVPSYRRICATRTGNLTGETRWRPALSARTTITPSTTSPANIVIEEIEMNIMQTLLLFKIDALSPTLVLREKISSGRFSARLRAEKRPNK